MKEMIFRCFLFSVKCHNILPGKGESDSCFVSNSCFGKDVTVMHKPRRRTNYYERFYFEYDGMLYKSKKNCCEQLGLEYGSVLGYRRVNNCSFTEAIAHFKGLQEEQQFIFRNRKWLSLQTCCDYYGLNKYSVLHYKYDYGFTIQESLEKAIKHAEQLKFKYKGKTYPSFPQCCKQMGIPTNTVRKCMKETGRSKAVALTYCIKKSGRKYGNPSPFIYRNKEYPMFTKCCCEYNIEPEKVRQKSKTLGVPLQRALDYFLLEHPVRRRKEFDKNLSESTSELCRTYGIKRSDIYNYLRRNNSSKKEAIKHYIELNATVGSEPIVFQGVEYVNLRECCRMLDISYRWVCEKILNQELSVEEVLLYYKGKKEALHKMEKEPIRLENGTRYNNLAEFCTALKICKKAIYGYICK